MSVFTKQFLSNFKYEIPKGSEKEDQENKKTINKKTRVKTKKSTLSTDKKRGTKQVRNVPKVKHERKRRSSRTLHKS